MEALRLMAVHAHPDDESSKGAATTARYVHEGAEVLVVTCTGGERGDVLNPKLKDDPHIQRDIVEVRRQEMARAQAADYGALKAGLMAAVLDSFGRLASVHELVLVEGAGSPAEVNLRPRDIANMGFARAAGVPVVLAGDIEPGKVFDAVMPLDDVAEAYRIIRGELEAYGEGLADKAEANMRTLSGGMKRRLLVAKAMVHSPPILVLDEPTAGVDIALREMLWTNVRALNAQGMTVILTTHYLEEAEQMCDEIAIINHGEKVVQERTDSLLACADSKTLVVDPGPWAGSLPPLPEGVTAERRADGRLALTYAPGRVQADRIIDALRQGGVPMADVSSEQPDLQDVFLSMTRG